MKIIPIYDNKGIRYDVKVDDEDYEVLIKYQWKWRDGYATRKLANNKYYQMHRQIMGVAFKEPILVDHIDRDHTNNQRSNLRRANRFQNQQNRNTNKGNTLPKGIRKLPSGNYGVRIQWYGERRCFGAFATVEEAVEARNNFAKNLHGEFYNPSHLLGDNNAQTNNIENNG